jgi:hypothetical protein
MRSVQNHPFCGIRANQKLHKTTGNAHVSIRGAFWHGIMHRREPDAWNSKYWFRKVGRHPVLDMLVSEAPQIGYSYRNPEEFVDFCEGVRGTGSADEELARRVQLLEWQLLFDWCWNKAKQLFRT